MFPAVSWLLIVDWVMLLDSRMRDDCVLHKITQDIHMYLHDTFCQDPIISDKVRILAGNAFYIWYTKCNIRHFYNWRTSNLRREVLQSKLNIMVKTLCLYHLCFWRSSRYNFLGKKQNVHYGGHIGFTINVKTTYYEYAHQEDYVYTI